VTVTGLVLAAGSSNRLGRPKQLLAFRGRTLLDAALEQARQCPFDQVLVTLGAAADDVRAHVDLTGVEVVDNHESATGCSSSIVAALGHIDPAADGLVLLLGDQPGVTVAAVEALLGEGPGAPLAVVRYDDGIGHPFWFRRDAFADLATLHGDKAVWKLLESGRHPVAEVRVTGPMPLDVDTEEDYEALLAAERVP
jgi:molybdenum cofactor cytidylyltransferase